MTNLKDRLETIILILMGAYAMGLVAGTIFFALNLIDRIFGKDKIYFEDSDL